MPTLLRADARRPASWLALAGAAGAAWWLSRAACDAVPWDAAGVAAGVVATAAAIGDVPRGTGVSPAVWTLVRAAWPAVGALAAAGASATVAPVFAVLLGVAAAATTVLSHGRRESPAEPLAAALLAGAAAAGGVIAVRAASPAAPAWAAPAAAAVGWAVVTLGGRATREALPDRVDGGLGGAARGPFGGATATVTMTTALAATVAWLFLAPDLAWWYALVAGSWFVAAAVPVAALGPGEAGDRSRRDLVTTAGGPTAVRGAGWSRGPGAGRTAWRVAAAHAAVFGWPPVVAAVLAGGVDQATALVAVALALIAAAAAVAAVTGVAVATGLGRETALAVALAPALVVAAVCCAPLAAPKAAPLPQRNEVEQSSGFWKTPGPPQGDVGQTTPGGAVPWNCNPMRA